MQIELVGGLERDMLIGGAIDLDFKTLQDQYFPNQYFPNQSFKQHDKNKEKRIIIE